MRWLLEQGADPEAKGALGSAIEYTRTMESEEIRTMIEDGVTRKRWVNNKNVTKSNYV